MELFKYPIGMEVRHKKHDRIGAITGAYYNENHEKIYYRVDIYATETKRRYPDGTWEEDNIVPCNFKNNKEASLLLSKER
jgi:hypothetical protein